VLDVLAGYEPGDATWAPPPPRPFAALAGLDPGRLRIGLALIPPLEDATLDPACEQAARDAAAMLESLGHAVEEVSPPWSVSGLLSDFTRAFGPLISFTTWLGGQLAGREPGPDDVEPLTWAMYEHTRQQNTLSYLSAQSRLEGLARTIVAWAGSYDLVLTPGLARRPVRIGEIHGRGPDAWGHYRRSGYFTPYTAIVNVTGQPAVMLPLYHGEDGLPTAVHLIGPPAREDLLLSVALQLEAALPWAERRPQLTAEAR
jgi:amidase